MATYSISELQEITGIKAHTIRTWEKRYSVINPDRNASNVRTYSEHDLQRLQKIAYLNTHGWRISKIASMTPAEIEDQVTQLRSSHADAQDKIGALSMALIDMDPSKLECLVHSQIRHLGAERAMLEVVFPFLEKMSLLLMSGAIGPVHERLFQEILQQKIMAAIDQTPRVSSDEPRVLLLSTVEGLMDIRRLFFHHAARSRGLHVINLGNQIREGDLRTAIEQCAPNFCFVLHDMAAPDTILQGIIDALEQADSPELLIFGEDLHFEGMTLPEGTRVLDDVLEAVDFLTENTTVSVNHLP